MKKQLLILLISGMYQLSYAQSETKIAEDGTNIYLIKPGSFKVQTNDEGKNFAILTINSNNKTTKNISHQNYALETNKCSEDVVTLNIVDDQGQIQDYYRDLSLKGSGRISQLANMMCQMYEKYQKNPATFANPNLPSPKIIMSSNDWTVIAESPTDEVSIYKNTIHLNSDKKGTNAIVRVKNYSEYKISYFKMIMDNCEQTQFKVYNLKDDLLGTLNAIPDDSFSKLQKSMCNFYIKNK